MLIVKNDTKPVIIFCRLVGVSLLSYRLPTTFRKGNDRDQENKVKKNVTLETLIEPWTVIESSHLRRFYRMLNYAQSIMCIFVTLYLLGLAWFDVSLLQWAEEIRIVQEVPNGTDRTKIPWRSLDLDVLWTRVIPIRLIARALISIIQLWVGLQDWFTLSRI